MESIVFPTVTCMIEEGRTFKGVLYCGLMLTTDGPKVLEYNCRFGDPETQPQMLRLESDLVELLLASAEGEALRGEVRWSRKPSACVVLASGGYPNKYDKGKPITGLEEAAAVPGVVLFHAGTASEGGNVLTNGGRVLDVCATDATLEETMKRIYEAIGMIYFEAMHYRRDIGAAKEE